LRECQTCAKLSSRQRVATLKNLKCKIYFDLFNTFLVTTWFHVLFHSWLFFTIILQCRKQFKKIKHNWMSGCVQTFDWFCISRSYKIRKYCSFLDIFNKTTSILPFIDCFCTGSWLPSEESYDTCGVP
jgi:hypothetical protein